MIKLFFELWTLSVVSGQHIYGSHQYFVKSSVQNNTDAQEKCSAIGGKLAVIYNESVNAFIAGLIARVAPQFPLAERPKAYWIGLRRTGPNSNDFEWDDGSPLNYTNWSTGEPNNGNGNERCVMFGHPCCGLTVWFDVGCNTNFGPDRVQPGYICQKPTGPTRTTAQVFTIEASHSTSVPFAIFTLQSTSMLIETTTSTPMHLLILFPIIVGILLVIVLLITGVYLVRRLKKKSQLEQGGSAINDVVPVKKETNLYETPFKTDHYFNQEKRNSTRLSAASQTDSFDDDDQSVESNSNNQICLNPSVEEGTYCSVDDVDEIASSAYVPLSVMKKLEENFYSVPEPVKKLVNKGDSHNIYDALACTN